MIIKLDNTKALILVLLFLMGSYKAKPDALTEAIAAPTQREKPLHYRIGLNFDHLLNETVMAISRNLAQKNGSQG